MILRRLISEFVIPAQAEIQAIEVFLPCRSIQNPCPLRGPLFSLDSRLRGNDGPDETPKMKAISLPVVGAVIIRYLDITWICCV
jgi:hypothetical protein